MGDILQVPEASTEARFIEKIQALNVLLSSLTPNENQNGEEHVQQRNSSFFVGSLGIVHILITCLCANEESEIREWLINNTTHLSEAVTILMNLGTILSQNGIVGASTALTQLEYVATALIGISDILSNNTILKSIGKTIRRTLLFILGAALVAPTFAAAPIEIPILSGIALTAGGAALITLITEKLKFSIKEVETENESMSIMQNSEVQAELQRLALEQNNEKSEEGVDDVASNDEPTTAHTSTAAP